VEWTPVGAHGHWMLAGSRSETAYGTPRATLRPMSHGPHPALVPRKPQLRRYAAMLLVDHVYPIPGAVFAGRYLIERVLGEGAMGKVVAATDLETGSRVAIKCLLPMHAGNASAVARFQREARATERLRSEHVVWVLDHGAVEAPDGAPVRYIVME